MTPVTCVNPVSSVIPAISPAPVTRRVLVTLAATGFAAAFAPAAPGAGRHPQGMAAGTLRLDPAEPTSVLRALRRILFADDDRLVFWWMRGTKYGMVDNVTTPLFDMHVGSIARCHGSGPEFVATSLEIVFYTDLATGALLERWYNPYTDEWLDLGYAPAGPTRIPYGLAGPGRPPDPPGSKIDSTRTFGPPLISGDDVWLRNDSNAVVTRSDGSGRPFVVHDWQTYHARRGDVENLALPDPPADISFMDLTSWPRSFHMEDRPGTRMSRCVGHKAGTLAALPPRFLELLAARMPEVYRDPAGALEADTRRFER